MLPGHCFTIEVRVNIVSIVYTSNAANSLHLSKGTIRELGYFRMAGLLLPKYVLVLICKHALTMTALQNCARSAQAEHMVLVTETGIEVLT